MTELAFSVAEKVIEKLGSLAYQQISLTRSIESDLKKLQDTMSTVQAVLLDAEEKQDQLSCEDLRRQVVKKYGSTSRKVCRFFSSSNSLAFRNKMGHRVKGVRERLDLIAKDRDQFHLEMRLDDNRIVHRETHSFVRDCDVIGRADDKQEIIDLLMLPNDNDNISVISIVGIGGLGKTTLAQWVYNDEWVAKNFDPKIWVCVSEDFNVLRLAKEMLNKLAGGGIRENMSLDEVQAGLRSNLNEKNFFIVLDDVWNDDRNKWIGLKNLLIGGQGSKVLVTTRSHKVALAMAPGPIHDIKGLPENDCLLLFLRCAFNEREHEQYPNLVKIGEEIVKKCGGVPLAVKTLGSLLYSKTEEHDWISIRENDIWELEQKEDDILPALKLSYNKLPSYLKECFAYCSLYPKDFRYYKRELIQCWMANGLLKKSNKSTELEDIGEQYLKELLSRSFFQEVEGEGNIVWSFKMHDLLHDLSFYVAQNDYCLIQDTSKTNKFEKARHISILDHKLGVDATITFLHKLSNNVRTINFSFDDWGESDSININESLVETCISRFKHLRLLNLRNSMLETLSSSISTLKHLRYLNLNGNKKIKKLPDSICDLQNLETLILLGCNEIEELPRDIRKMVSLRYFGITTKQTRLPANGIECMPSLRHLSFNSCYRLECFNEGIQRLTALRNLSFNNCKSLISLPQGMKHLTALEYLDITNCEKLKLMEGDDYPTRLRTLCTWGLPQLVSLPQWLKGSTNTLQFLYICYCKNLGVLPEWLTDLSSLRKLLISNCPKLSSLPEGMDRLTALRELEIFGCPELRRDYEREVSKDWGKMVEFSFF
ncbi:hypothetical protein ACB098_09G167000 [Castanea mollissima]